MSGTLPSIAITLGDPGGIGPEVVAKALADDALRHTAHWTVVGSRGVFHEACTRWSPGVAFYEDGGDLAWRAGPADSERIRVLDSGHFDASEGLVHSDSARQGAASLAWVREAIDGARAGKFQGVVTAPISKHAWALAGERRFAGHTELFADAFGNPLHAMMFVSPVVCVILATIHVPLASVPGLITTERVLSTIRMGHATCERLGLHPRGRAARIAVCGLNPHAGEHGLLGSEDDAIIAPAIEAARNEWIDASGPYPGDTIFQKAVRQQGREPRFDLVVAMYHDQGLGPLKLVAFDSAVNMTVGLPIVRTSPDHGTAFDIAGRGVADAGSMRSAMEMAVRLAGA